MAGTKEELPYMQAADALLRECAPPGEGGLFGVEHLVSKQCPVCLSKKYGSRDTTVDWIRLNRGWLGNEKHLVRRGKPSGYEPEILTGQQLHELMLRRANLPASRRRRKVRNEAIRRDYGSHTSMANSLAVFYKLTERRIWQILAIDRGSDTLKFLQPVDGRSDSPMQTVTDAVAPSVDHGARLELEMQGEALDAQRQEIDAIWQWILNFSDTPAEEWQRYAKGLNQDG
jgi:hypothetical protein